MIRIRRYKVYTVYDFEDDIVAITKCLEDAQRIAKYYAGYFRKEYMIKRY